MVLIAWTLLIQRHTTRCCTCTERLAYVGTDLTAETTTESQPLIFQSPLSVNSRNIQPSNSRPACLLPVDIRLSLLIRIHGRYGILHARHSILLDSTTQHLQRQIFKTGPLLGARFSVSTVPTILCVSRSFILKLTGDR